MVQCALDITWAVADIDDDSLAIEVEHMYKGNRKRSEDPRSHRPLGMAHPMGPLHLADFIGLDVCLSILRVLHDGFGQPKYAPCPLLVNMVTVGKLGVKSGEGFYVHTKGSKDIQVAPAFS